MTRIADDLRDMLERRAASVEVTPDLVDVTSRLGRSGHGSRRAFSLAAAAAASIAFVALGFVVWAFVSDGARSDGEVTAEGGADGSSAVVTEPPDLRVFMDVDATDEELAAVEEILAAEPRVVSWTYVDRDATHVEFRQEFADASALFESISSADLPTSFTVDVEDAADVDVIEGLAARLESMTSVRVALSASEIPVGRVAVLEAAARDAVATTVAEQEELARREEERRRALEEAAANRPEPLTPDEVGEAEPRSPLLDPPSAAVLLFDDGYDGVTAVDLNERVVTRSVVDGQRAGDPQYRLDVVGDRLVVGWSPVVSASLSGDASIDLGGTVFVPAVEDGAVWVIDNPYPQIGPRPTTYRLMDVTTGAVLLEGDGMDGETSAPSHAVDGGLLVVTADGIVLWTPDGTTPVTDEPGFVAAASVDVVAWCPADCSALHITDLSDGSTALVPAAEGNMFQPHAAAVSPDGSTLVIVQGPGGQSQLVDVVDLGTGEVTSSLVIPDFEDVGGVTWTPDGTQFFVTENSHGSSETWYLRIDLQVGDHLTGRIPAGGFLSVGAVDPSVIDISALSIGDPVECPAPVVQPSGRTEPCAFEF